MADQSDFFAAMATWLRSDSGAGGLVILTGDVSGDRRILLDFTAAPKAKYPSLVFRDVTDSPAIPASDVEVGRVNHVLVDFTAWSTNDDQEKVLKIMNRLARVLRPPDTEMAAFDPVSNMSNSLVRVVSHRFLSRLPVLYDEDRNAWSGTITTEWVWRAAD